MKLHAETTASLNTVTAYGAGYIEINAQRFDHSLVVMPELVLKRWRPTSFETLTAEDFTELLEFKPALIVLGTGERQRFVHPRLLQGLHAQRIGIEMMDTQAACRTYNILMSEGRQVLAAILV